MSPDEYNAMKDEAQEIALPLSMAILNRSKETMSVPINGVGDTTLDIEIRVMLNKREVELQSKFFTAMKHLQYVEDEYYYWLAGSFLDLICIDPELDIDFWRSEDIDPYIIQELIAAFVKSYNR